MLEFEELEQDSKITIRMAIEAWRDEHLKIIGDPKTDRGTRFMSAAEVSICEELLEEIGDI